MFSQMISSDARKAILIGRQNHWRFKVIGNGDLPQEHTYKDEWWFEPVSVPAVAQDRLNALQASGLSFRGFLIAHEAPKRLTSPKPISKPNVKVTNSPDIVPTITTIAEFFATSFVLVFSLFFQAILLDPALIVVLEDGTWLEVMTWYEE